MVSASDLSPDIAGRRHVGGPLLFGCPRGTSHDPLLELTVAKRAVLEAQCLKLCLKCFVLASLASVVLLLQDALARSDARREVTATLATVYVKLSDHGVAVALRTLHLLAGLVHGRMPRE